MRRNHFVPFLSLSLLFPAIGCGSSEDSQSASAGGTGATGTGGVNSSGSGGSTVFGGVSSGGAASTGGSTATGGIAGIGGGSAATGGTTVGIGGATVATGGTTEGSGGTTEGRGGTTEGRGGTTEGRGGTTEGSGGTTEGSGGTTEGSGGATEGSGGATEGSGGATEGSGGATEGSGGTDDTTPVGIHGNLSVSGTHLVDEQGANVQLKGISSQWLNLEKDGYALSLDALIWMRDHWGLTVFRAAMGAEAAGVEPGYTTNSTAQAEMQRQIEIVIDNAISAGVYVIVDWHAHNALGQQSAAIAFFEDLAQRFGQYPNVLFEPFNEPLQVDWETELKPYHEAVVAAIRGGDADGHDNVVILGTPQWDQLPTDAAGSPVSGSNLMYTVHFYSCDHNADSGSPPPFGDGISHLQRAEDALQAGLPIFVTEWGATYADGGVGATEVCSSEADDWHDWMDANQIGWTAWKLDDCDTENPADTSCLLQRDAPLAGEWDSLLNGHGSYVVGKLQD